MRILILILLVAVSGNTFGQSTLDGKTFKIKLKVSGPERLGREWTSDELTFSDGKFVSREMGEGEKFPPFGYTLIEDSLSKGSIKFIAAGQNPGGSTIAWDGKVKGNKIEGSATWTNRNGPQKLLFKGTLKK